MRRVSSILATAALLIGLPLAAAAHDDDRGWRGYERHGHYYQPGPKHVRKHYYAPPVVYRPAPPVVYRPAPPVVYRPAPPVVYRPAPPVVYYPAPRVVERPVYVPAPPPAPRPWPFNQVDIGFRIFF